jgi:hypothetical protein
MRIFKRRPNAMQGFTLYAGIFLWHTSKEWLGQLLSSALLYGSTAPTSSLKTQSPAVTVNAIFLR